MLNPNQLMLVVEKAIRQHNTPIGLQVLWGISC
uniref:Dentin matrix protein 1 (DMP1) n=1 Tax=Myoviridae sp. ctYA416 TaxID=2825125 RepID=A0A8S5UTD3_9CAUD|nr:MAG TPA: Dentin matrix protein 1 (DMP1) [Myoviridae sp. ctYA416]